MANLALNPAPKTPFLSSLPSGLMSAKDTAPYPLLHDPAEWSGGWDGRPSTKPLHWRDNNYLCSKLQQASSSGAKLSVPQSATFAWYRVQVYQFSQGWMAPSPHTPSLHHDARPGTWRCLRSWQPKMAPIHTGRPCRGTGTPLLLVVPMATVSVSSVCPLPPFCSSRESLRKEHSRHNIAKGRALTAITLGISGKTLDGFLPLNPTQLLKERLGQWATLLLLFGRKGFPDPMGLYAICKLLRQCTVRKALSVSSDWPLPVPAAFPHILPCPQRCSKSTLQSRCCAGSSRAQPHLPESTFNVTSWLHTSELWARWCRPLKKLPKNLRFWQAFIIFLLCLGLLPALSGTIENAFDGLLSDRIHHQKTAHNPTLPCFYCSAKQLALSCLILDFTNQHGFISTCWHSLPLWDGELGCV